MLLDQSARADGKAVIDAPRIRELDALRGVLALGVVFFHLYPQSLFWLWSCVDGFFVLSGFVISRVLLQTRLDIPGLLSFYARRALRIWPVYYLTLVVALCLHVGYALKNGESLAGIGGVWQSLLFVQHIEFYWKDVASYLSFNYIRWFGHSWSLAVEEQFYWLWPLVILAFRGSRRLIGSICLLLLVLGIFVRHQGVLVMLLGTRIDGLALGSLLALLELWVGSGTPDFARRARFLQFVLSAVTIIAIALALALYLIPGWAGGQVEKLYLIDSTWVVLIFALFFFGVVGSLWLNNGAAVTSLFRAPLLLWLGGRSYAIYMFHPLVQAAVERAVSHGKLPESIVSIGTVGLSVALAALSYNFVEHWFTGFRHRFPMRPA
jgi:peptidoglycan/LPS O-acetylase OafA/YrhL